MTDTNVPVYLCVSEYKSVEVFQTVGSLDVEESVNIASWEHGKVLQSGRIAVNANINFQCDHNWLQDSFFYKNSSIIIRYDGLHAVFRPHFISACLVWLQPN